MTFGIGPGIPGAAAAQAAPFLRQAAYLVIPAKAGIHFALRSSLDCKSKVQMDPSFRWDDGPVVAYPNERAVLITLMPSKRVDDDPCDTADTWLGWPLPSKNEPPRR